MYLCELNNYYSMRYRIFSKLSLALSMYTRSNGVVREVVIWQTKQEKVDHEDHA